MPLVSRPTSALTMKMPPRARTNHRVSSALVPMPGMARPNVETKVRQSSSKPPGGGVPSAAGCSTTSSPRLMVTIRTPVTSASQPIRLTVPRDIVLSNQYRAR
jgi:hypothetical protein